jgi:hypothetical protein
MKEKKNKGKFDKAQLYKEADRIHNSMQKKPTMLKNQRSTVKEQEAYDIYDNQQEGKRRLAQRNPKTTNYRKKDY